MKRLFLGVCLMFYPIQADNVRDFLSTADIVDGEQYELLNVMLHIMEELSVENRTIIYIYLENLEDKTLSGLDSDEKFCFECVALQEDAP